MSKVTHIKRVLTDNTATPIEINKPEGVYAVSVAGTYGGGTLSVTSEDGVVLYDFSSDEALHITFITPKTFFDLGGATSPNLTLRVVDLTQRTL